MSVHIRFWGTRGSVPAPGPQTVRYGGNTPCVELRLADDRLIILDAGTGIRELGRSLLARAGGTPIEGDIFLSHAHWDHIQGFPFFAPMFMAGNRFTIWGSPAPEPAIERAVRDQMSATVFPVPFDELQASVEFRHLHEGLHQGSGYDVRAMLVCHPGGALGYRFTAGDGSGTLVYIPDNEIGGAAPGDTSPGGRDALVAFAAGARVLVHDATYTAAEYERHRGWGHSAYDDVVQLALDAHVERLVLFHHHPERTDDELDRQVQQCRALAGGRGGGLTIIAAAEGMSLTV
jgi:phosphoribosyl 1,2-cyclic phosphodiesterase